MEESYNKKALIEEYFKKKADLHRVYESDIEYINGLFNNVQAEQLTDHLNSWSYNSLSRESMKSNIPQPEHQPEPVKELLHYLD